jgi:hypothetical protein
VSVLNRRIIFRNFILFSLLACLLLLSGCSNKPYLTGDNSYRIKTIKISGEIQSLSINLPWNFNMAIMSNLLMESSFVLSDLHPLNSAEIHRPSVETVFLESIFPRKQTMTLFIDNQTLEMDIDSIQIEVKGPNVGRIILNQTLVYQGIDNPGLEPAFDNFIQELKEKKTGH